MIPGLCQQSDMTSSKSCAFFCGWHSTLLATTQRREDGCRADTAGNEKGRKGHQGQEGQSVFGVVGALCCGISEDYGSLEAFFFCPLCFCIIPGRLPTLYPVPPSLSSLSSFQSFTLLPPCALHHVQCQQKETQSPR